MERRREKERQRRKRDADSINNETFIKARSAASSALHGQTANAGGIVAVVSWAATASRQWATMLQVCEDSKATCSLLALSFVDALCYPQGTQFAFYSLLIVTRFSLHLLSHSFHSYSWCFPYWQPPLDKCVYGIFHVYKPLHKLLSKINKRRAERGVGKNEGQDRKNIEREPYVMLERPLRALSIFPSIFSVQACICHH